MTESKSLMGTSWKILDKEMTRLNLLWVGRFRPSCGLGNGSEGRRAGYSHDALAMEQGKAESRMPRRRLEGSLGRRYLDTRLGIITLQWAIKIRVSEIN